MNCHVFRKALGTLLATAMVLTLPFGTMPVLAEPEAVPPESSIPESFSLVTEPEDVPDYVYYVRDRKNKDPESFTWVDSEISGKALQLDGNTEYIRLSSTKVKDLTAFTFSAWVNWSGTDGSSDKEQRLLSVFKTENHCLMVSPHNQDSVRDLNGIEVSLEDRQIEPISLYHEVDGPQHSALPVGEWHHVAVVFADTMLALYIDGTPYVQSNPQLSVEEMGLQRFVIGSEFEGDAQFNGLIDEAVVYTEALDADQILLLSQKKDPEKGVTPSTQQEVLATRPATEPTVPLRETPTRILGLPPVLLAVLGGTVVLVIILSLLLSFQNKNRQNAPEEDHP